MKRSKRVFFLILIVLSVFLFSSCNKSQEEQKYFSLSDLEVDGIPLGVHIGTIYDQMTVERYPNSEIKYFNTAAENAYALSKGEIEGFLIDEPVARNFEAELPGITFLDEKLSEDNYAFAFPKTDEGKKLSDEVSEFIRKLKSEGKLEEIYDAWFSDDREAQVTDFDSLTGENGTIRYGTDGEYPPFNYVRDGQLVGLEIDILIRFCKEKGYALDISIAQFSGLIPSLGVMADMIGSGMSVTEERKEAVYFCEPYYNGGTVMMVYDGVGVNESFLDKTKKSFEKTFIRESRYKLILEGILTTVHITLLSAIFGTILGFLVCLIRRAENPILHALSTAYVRILQGTPIVVLLMILYYIIFAGSGLDGIYVAIIGFSLNFSAYVGEMMKSGIDAVGKGQWEAAHALGFTKVNTFTRIIFPQASKHFLPIYKGELISLVKGTSVVGYIAVQDLTKMSDIIRSRTYEAFFPLVASAVIYFILAFIFVSILEFFEKKMTPQRNKKTLKGVKLS